MAPDPFRRRRPPERRQGGAVACQAHGVSRHDRVDARVRRATRVPPDREVAGDVSLVEPTGVDVNQQPLKAPRPQDLMAPLVIVERAYAGEVARQHDCATSRVAEHGAPVADDTAESGDAPPFVGRPEERSFPRRLDSGVTELAHQIGAVVETTVPHQQLATRAAGSRSGKAGALGVVSHGPLRVSPSRGRTCAGGRSENRSPRGRRPRPRHERETGPGGIRSRGGPARRGRGEAGPRRPSAAGT